MALATIPGCEPAWPATPPASLNYQGVLRDASNLAVSGAFDMVFRFFDAPTASNEILVDSHQAAMSGAVVVTGGVFDTNLGGGIVADGAGPGTYGSLAQVFRDFDAVWMEIAVNAETMSPRVRIVASAYALNASNLEGRPASGFLDTSAAPQAKLGPLAVNVTAPSVYAVVAGGDAGGGAFFDLSGTGIAYLGTGDTGLEAQGNTAGRFDQSGGFSSALLAWGDLGMSATGASAGGVFSEMNGTGSATLASSDIGVQGLGSTAGAYFLSTGGSGIARLGYGDYGVDASGSQAGGNFSESDSAAWARLANGGYGIQARGAQGGIFYEDSNDSYAVTASSGRGVEGAGTFVGGTFRDWDQTGLAFIGYGNTGIEASGSEMGGYFYDSNESGWARLGWGTSGIQAWGSFAGGYFRDSDDSGHASVGFGDEGILASGLVRGGQFIDQNASGAAVLAEGDRGIWGRGLFAGGTFSHPNNVTFWADVATPTHKIAGTGAVSFVQNHPVEKDRTITYAAPEGDEVAVYTRGTARLAGGEARVELGETFAFVANPEVGLTAHLTPRGEPVALAVVSLSTRELVVRGSPEARDGVVFDYIVWGLRIGFEDLPVVRPKTRDAFLPDPGAVQAEYGGDPDLARFNARERHTRMLAESGLPGPVNGHAAMALAAAINAGREQTLSEADRLAREERERSFPDQLVAPAREEGAREAPTRDEMQPHPGIAGIDAGPVSGRAMDRTTGAEPTAPIGCDSSRAPHPAPHPLVPIVVPVNPGDLLVLDPDVPGALRPSTAALATAVAGCAVAAGGGIDLPAGHTLAGVWGIVSCRVDATYGSIAVGDLLTASPTPAHAMRAGENAGGAILGKAMEPLAGGSGMVRVLIGLR